MHRWAQAQTFRGLCAWIADDVARERERPPHTFACSPAACGQSLTCLDFSPTARLSRRHGRRTARSGATSMMIRVGNAVFQFGSALFLARLLTPEDYGLVGMVLAITGFATLVCRPRVREAIVQRERITPGEVSALFWITIDDGLRLTLLLAAMAPLSHVLWRAKADEHRAGLVAGFRDDGAVVSASGAHAPSDDVSGQRVDRGHSRRLSGLLAIVMAFTGWHYWALVVTADRDESSDRRRRLVELPLAARPADADVRRARDARFRRTLIGNSLTDYARANLDRVAIGWRYGAASLGQYQNA